MRVKLSISLTPETRARSHELARRMGVSLSVLVEQSLCSAQEILVKPKPMPTDDPVFYIKTVDGSRVTVEWKSAWKKETDSGSCLYHATADGLNPVCPTRVELGDHNPYPSVFDRSNDLMTCQLCAERVFRAPRSAR